MFVLVIVAKAVRVVSSLAPISTSQFGYLYIAMDQTKILSISLVAVVVVFTCSTASLPIAASELPWWIVLLPLLQLRNRHRRRQRPLTSQSRRRPRPGRAWEGWRRRRRVVRAALVASAGNVASAAAVGPR